MAVVSNEREIVEETEGSAIRADRRKWRRGIAERPSRRGAGLRYRGRSFAPDDSGRAWQHPGRLKTCICGRPTTQIAYTGVIRHVNLRGERLDKPLDEMVTEAERAGETGRAVKGSNGNISVDRTAIRGTMSGDRWRPSRKCFGHRLLAVEVSADGAQFILVVRFAYCVSHPGSLSRSEPDTIRIHQPAADNGGEHVPAFGQGSKTQSQPQRPVLRRPEGRAVLLPRRHRLVTVFNASTARRSKST